MASTSVFVGRSHLIPFEIPISNFAIAFDEWDDDKDDRVET